MPKRTGYKLSRSGTVPHLTVPRNLADLIPETARFDPELTEDGVLFRLRPDDAPTQLPSWIREKGTNSSV